MCFLSLCAFVLASKLHRVKKISWALEVLYSILTSKINSVFQMFVLQIKQSLKKYQRGGTTPNWYIQNLGKTMIFEVFLDFKCVFTFFRFPLFSFLPGIFRMLLLAFLIWISDMTTCCLVRLKQCLVCVGQPISAFIQIVLKSNIPLMGISCI